MTSTFNPQQLDIAALARAATTLQGSEALQKYERATQDLRRLDADFAQILLQWQARGEMMEALGGEPQVWLHLDVQVSAPMTCQRCLERVDMPVTVARSFRFVASEQEAEAQDDEAEEDLLVLSKRFDLAGLIEDELLMALPMVPKHQVCPTPVKMSVADADFEAPTEEKPNPFKVLAALKKP